MNAQTSFAALLVMLVPLWTNADINSNKDTEEIAEIQEVQPVMVDSANGNQTSDLNATSDTLDAIQLFGRLHPAFVHLPLGLLVALILFELSIRSHAESDATLWLWGGTLASFFPAAVSGMWRMQEIAQMGAQTDASTHRNWMLSSLLLLVIAAIFRRYAQRDNFKFRRWSLIILASATACAFFGAHLGGKLVYGLDFLPF